MNVKGIMKRLRQNGFFLVCLILAVTFLVTGGRWREEGKGYLKNLTIQEDGEGVDVLWLKSVMQQTKGQEDGECPYTFAAWKQLKKEAVSTELGGRKCEADVLAVCGPSDCLLSFGKNLAIEDACGCIVGRKLAEELWGRGDNQGKKMRWRERDWTVRCVVEEPADLLMVQASEMDDEISFDRLSLSVKEGEDKQICGETFLNEYGLAGYALRFDYEYGFAWLKEMIPGRWSDYSGWAKNFKSYREAKARVSQAEKTCIEELGLEYKKKGGVFILFGILFGFVGSVRLAAGPHGFLSSSSSFSKSFRHTGCE